MIVDQVRDQVIVNTNNPIKQFTIKVDRKAFETLYKNLYQDKIGSIVREIASNARDSHVAADKTNLPIHIHLPNDLEPFFEVTDFGLGMEENFIYDIYTKIFESTKTTDQNAIGCWGLGSKTPFAYTDQFTIESKYNGIKSTYACFINDDGTPCVSKINDQPCDPRNGVNIKVPVKKYDFYTFNQKVVKYLKYFDPFPTVVGQEINIPERKQYLSEKDFILYNDNNINNLIMGGVPYTIDKYGFSKEIMSIGIDIFAEIGDVDVSPNRELLSYTEKTNIFISKKIDKIRLAITEQVKKEIEKATSLWQANINYQKIYHGMLRDFLQNIDYNGNTLYHSLNDGIFSKFPEIFLVTRGSKNSKKVKAIYDFDIPIFIITENRWLSKVKYYLETKLVNKAYVLNTKVKENIYNVSKPNFYKSTGIKEVLQKTHQLPKPPKKPPTSRIKSNKLNVLLWKGTDCNIRYASYNWSNTQVDFKPKSKDFFVLVNRYHLVGHSENSLKNKADVFKNKINIIGIRPSEKEKFIKNGWQEFFSFFDNYINKKINNEKLQYAKSWYEFNYKNFINGVSAKFDSDSPFGQFLEELKKYKDMYSKYNKYVQFTTCVVDLNNQFHEIMDNYPLLKILNCNQLEFERKNCIDYIKMIDEKNT